MALFFIPSALLLNVIGWTLLLLFMQVRSDLSFQVPETAEFFATSPDKIKWGHGINSQAQLKNSLEGNARQINLIVNTPMP